MRRLNGVQAEPPTKGPYFGGHVKNSGATDIEIFRCEIWTVFKQTVSGNKFSSEYPPDTIRCSIFRCSLRGYTAYCSQGSLSAVNRVLTQPCLQTLPCGYSVEKICCTPFTIPISDLLSSAGYLSVTTRFNSQRLAPGPFGPMQKLESERIKHVPFSGPPSRIVFRSRGRKTVDSYWISCRNSQKCPQKRVGISTFLTLFGLRF